MGARNADLAPRHPRVSAAERGAARRRERSASARFRVEPDGHRPVIDERNLHVGAEDAVGHRHAVAGDGLRKMLVETPALIRRGGRGKARPVALRLGGQRELADDEGGAAGVDERAVHAAGIVLENPQVDHLARQPVGLGLAIAGHGADQHEKTGADLADGFAGDCDGSGGDALDEGSHGGTSTARLAREEAISAC